MFIAKNANNKPSVRRSGSCGCVYHSNKSSLLRTEREVLMLVAINISPADGGENRSAFRVPPGTVDSLVLLQ